MLACRRFAKASMRSFRIYRRDQAHRSRDHKDDRQIAIEDIRIYIIRTWERGSHCHLLTALTSPRAKRIGLMGRFCLHPRQDLVELFDDTYYQEAIQAGYSIENYRTTPFGEFPKRTYKKGYKGNAVTRPAKKPSLFSRWFK